MVRAGPKPTRRPDAPTDAKAPAATNLTLFRIALGDGADSAEEMARPALHLL
jgi:hypothetical protein